MPIYRPCYATRESVKRALDVKLTTRSDQQIDEAIQEGSESVEGLLHRRFYPELSTRYIDWPNFQSTYPWKVYLDENELADITVTPPVLTSGGNVIDPTTVFWGSPEYADQAPYTRLELNRSSSSNFGQGNTPQRDIGLTGVFGYWLKTSPAGTITVAMTDTTSTSITVDSKCTVAAGVGDNIVIGTERLLITDKSMVSTTQTQASGLTTANTADVALGVQDGTKFSVYETLLLDSERLFVEDISGNTLTVKRAWDGSVLAAHVSSSAIYALRSLTVVRGALGSTAATHLINATATVAVVPSLVSQLSRAYALYQILGEKSGYSMTRGAGNQKQTGVGQSIPDIEDRCYQRYGRQTRQRTV